jgi:hypothetical protein
MHLPAWAIIIAKAMRVAERDLFDDCPHKLAFYPSFTPMTNTARNKIGTLEI